MTQCRNMTINIINHQYAYCCLLFGDLFSSCPPTHASCRFLSLVQSVCAASLAKVDHTNAKPSALQDEIFPLYRHS